MAVFAAIAARRLSPGAGPSNWSSVPGRPLRCPGSRPLRLPGVYETAGIQLDQRVTGGNGCVLTVASDRARKARSPLRLTVADVHPEPIPNSFSDLRRNALRAESATAQRM